VGAVQNVIDRLRGAFASDKERGGQLLAKGSTSPTYPDSGYDLLQAYGYDALSDYLRLEHDLISRYVDYEEMDDEPTMASSLDIYADDASQPDTQLQRTVWISSPDKTLQGVLDDLFYKRLRLDEEIWEIVRSLVKYGNDYEEMLVTKDGVVGLNFLPAPTVRRVEGPRGELYGFVQDFKGRFGYSPQEFQKILAQRTDAIRQTTQPGAARPPGNLLQRVSALEPWEVAHFRLRGKHRRSIYGYSVLEPARWIWKRLMLLEDAAMIYRLQRAPERFAFYVDVGDLPPAEALAFVNKIRQQHKKKRFVNPSTGKLDMKFEPLAQDEDFWVPVRKGVEGTRIEVLGGPSWQCLAGSTRVPLLDGTQPTIRELVTRGGEFWLYSVNESGKVVPGLGRAARRTHTSAEIWEVGLDSGEVIRCTGNHPFLSRDGKWSMAEHLRPGDSLMPLYRKESSRGRGDYLTGYEKVYDPKKDKFVYTHHRVYESLHGDPKVVWASGGVIHHVNHRKTDNNPENLKAVNRKEHAREHSEAVKFMHTPEAKAKAREASRSPARRRKLRASWTESRKGVHREMMIERMGDKVARAEKAHVLAEWNRSEDHRSRIRGAGNPRWRDLSADDLAYLVLATGARNIKELMHRGRVSQSVIDRVLKAEGLTWNVFAARNIPGWRPKGRALSATNHTVVFVRKTEDREAVYDLTVEGHHNFAIGAGVFVSNSMDDVEYFQTKLFTALKVPKAYLAQDDNTARAVLSSEDVRFARSILRVQREVRNGLRKVARTHLAALNIDPYANEYNIHMTVPSAIFELAQLEVRNARADLASRMREHVSLRWVLENVYQLSNEDIGIIVQERSEDVIREGKAQAEVEKLSAMAQAAAEPPAAGGGAEGVSPTSRLKLIERKLNALPMKLRGGISEQELLRGNKQAEKRADGKLESLMKANDLQARRLKEVGALLREVVAAAK